MVRYPNPDTCEAVALALMLAGHAIDHTHFFTITGSHRLAAYIHTLRKDLKWPVESRYQHTLSGDDEVYVYSLPDVAISQAGDSGQRFASAKGMAPHFGDENLDLFGFDEEVG